MTTVNDELRALMRARDMTDPIERANFLRRLLAKLVHSHLRRPPMPGVADEADRVLMIVSYLATKQVGAFGWGEPEAIGPTVLGLVEQLTNPSEERQQAVVSALHQVLQLLPMGSASALACFGRETSALLEALAPVPSTAPAALALGDDGSVRAFEEFALMCSDPEPEDGAAAAPSTA
jgi:hypothetical protein